MMHFNILINLLLLVCLCTCAKLPSSFKKCNSKKSDFNQCLSEAIPDAIRHLNKPLREVGLPNFEPLEIPSLTIGAGTRAVGFAQNYKNVKIMGLTKINQLQASADLKSKTLTLNCFFPQLAMKFNYEIDGKILVLPISGKGPGSITMENVKSTLTFHFEEYSKNNQKHLKVTSYSSNLNPGFIKFGLDNLFNGDKNLGDNINNVLNENWKDLFEDVKGGYEEALMQIFTSVFNNLLEKVPLSELFETE